MMMLNQESGALLPPPSKASYCNTPDSRNAARTVSCQSSPSGASGSRKPCAISAHLGHRPLDRHRVGFDEKLVMQRQHAVVDAHRLGHVAGHGRHAQFVHRARRDVGGDGDIALAAAQHQRDRGGVVARVDRERRRRQAQQVGGAGDIAGRFLDADDARHLRQAQHGLVGHVRHGAAGHVVQDDRQVDRFGDLAEMPVHAFLRRPVVVRHDLQRRVGAGFLRIAGQFDRLDGRVAAGAGDDGNAPCRMVDRDLDQFAMLVHGDRRRFAGGADDDDAVGAFRDVPVDELAQARQVETAVGVHGSDDCYDAALDHDVVWRKIG